MQSMKYGFFAVCVMSAVAMATAAHAEYKPTAYDACTKNEECRVMSNACPGDYRAYNVKHEDAVRKAVENVRSMVKGCPAGSGNAYSATAICQKKKCIPVIQESAAPSMFNSKGVLGDYFERDRM